MGNLTDKFVCKECEKSISISQQFENKPICISCATMAGLNHVLQNDRGDIKTHVRKADDKTEHSLEHATVDDLNIKESDWVDLPAGEFLMGSPQDEMGREADERLHRIEIAGIKMMAKAVTFEQYDLFCSMTGREKPSDKGWGRGNRPVIYVSYWDAVDYAEWLSEQSGWTCRLPTEAEWEYACRSGNNTVFYMGDSISCSQSNYDALYVYGEGGRGISRWRTLPVASFPPNTWGLYDMHGNVWEWCASEYDPDYSGLEMMDASFDRMNSVPRSLRGGSWHSRPVFLRSACRDRFAPEEKSHEFGFRLVRTA